MKHNLIENNIIILSKQTLDEFLKEDAPADLIALYSFYYYTAKWQETNQPKASVQYVASGLHWGKDKVIKTKKRLEEMGLISDIRDIDETTKQVKAWYVKLNYIWKTETHIPHSQRVAKPESGFQEANALSANKINALSANNKSPNGEALPRQTQKKEYGNPHVNTCVSHLKEKNGGNLDGSQKSNREYCWLALKKLGYGDDPPLAVKRLGFVIDAASNDQFHAKNATNFKYIFNNLLKILKNNKSKEAKVAIV